MCHPLPLCCERDHTPKGVGIQRRRRARAAADADNQLGLRYVGLTVQADADPQSRVHAQHCEHASGFRWGRQTGWHQQAPGACHIIQ